jgi:hypothetical protein
VALASAGVLVVMTLVNVIIGIPEPPAGAVTGLATAAVPVYFEGRARRRTTREQSLQAIAGMESIGLRHRLSVVIVVGALLLVLESLAGAAIGYLIALSRVVAGLPPTGADFAAAYGPGFLIVGAPVMVAVSVAIGIRARHYLPYRAAPWLALAAAVMVTARLAILWGSSAGLERLGVRIGYLSALTGEVPLAVLLFIALWLGSLWGGRNREVVLLSRNFKALNAEDRTATLEMLRAAAQHELSRVTRQDGCETNHPQPST